MKVKITATLLQQCEPAIEDAVKYQANAESTDPVYIKMHHAPGAKDGSVTIDADDADLHELIDRFEYEIETCHDNIADTSDQYERGYWLGRLRAAQCFVKKYKHENRSTT